MRRLLLRQRGNSVPTVERAEQKHKGQKIYGQRRSKFTTQNPCWESNVAARSTSFPQDLFLRCRLAAECQTAGQRPDSSPGRSFYSTQSSVRRGCLGVKHHPEVKEKESWQTPGHLSGTRFVNKAERSGSDAKGALEVSTTPPWGHEPG